MCYDNKDRYGCFFNFKNKYFAIPVEPEKKKVKKYLCARIDKFDNNNFITTFKTEKELKQELNNTYYVKAQPEIYIEVEE